VVPQHSVVNVYTATNGWCSVGVRVMRCTACVAELILMNVVPDATMLRDFEHHSLFCSACRLAALRVFSRHGREDDSEPVPIHDAPPTVPASTVQSQITAPGLFSRAVARIRGH
jgi:hypothetical protein